MESSGAANEKLLENGTSSDKPTKGKGGLRTMPFIIGTTRSLTLTSIINISFTSRRGEYTNSDPQNVQLSMRTLRIIMFFFF